MHHGAIVCPYENVCTETPSNLHTGVEKSCPCYCAGAHVGLDIIFRKQVQAFRTQLCLYITIDQQVITTHLDRPVGALPDHAPVA